MRREPVLPSLLSCPLLLQYAAPALCAATLIRNLRSSIMERYALSYRSEGVLESKKIASGEPMINLRVAGWARTERKVRSPHTTSNTENAVPDYPRPEDRRASSGRRRDGTAHLQTPGRGPFPRLRLQRRCRVCVSTARVRRRGGVDAASTGKGLFWRTKVSCSWLATAIRADCEPMILWYRVGGGPLELVPSRATWARRMVRPSWSRPDQGGCRGVVAGRDHAEKASSKRSGPLPATK